MIKGRSCKNPPYEFMTRAKVNSLGKTLTIKQALDKWWNSVRVHLPNGDTAIIYKCDDGEYELYEMKFVSKVSDWDAKDADILKMKIRLDDRAHEDGDGLPIVFATLIEKKGD